MADPITLIGTLKAIAVALALQVVSFLLTPKPKKPTPAEAKDFDAPTADAGRPIPVVFGTLTVKGTNILHYGEKEIVRRELKL